MGQLFDADHCSFDRCFPPGCDGCGNLQPAGALRYRIGSQRSRNRTVLDILGSLYPSDSSRDSDLVRVVAENEDKVCIGGRRDWGR